MTENERREIAQILADLETEEAEQEAARAFAFPRLARSLARLRQLTTSPTNAPAD